MKRLNMKCLSLLALAVPAVLSAGAAWSQTPEAALPAAEEPAKPYTLTGHIDLVSRYYLRGLTSTYGNVYPGLGNVGADAPESDKPALQWGVDYVHESGFYVGYWASMINYSYKQLGRSYDIYRDTNGLPAGFDFQDDRSIENDFYAGYNGKLGEDFGYVAGFTYYYYYNGKHSDAFETKLGVSWKSLALNTQTLLQDTTWGNTGDTYVTLNYTQPLPWDITLNASLGWYFYEKEGKYLGTHDAFTGSSCPSGTAFNVSGCFAGSEPIDNDFRHMIVGITQPIGNTGLTWGVQGILGGKNRFGISQANKAVASISYGF